MIALLLGLALAQDGLDAHGFDPVAFDGDLRDPVTVLRPGRMTQLEWYAGGLFEYAKSPLVREYADGTYGPWLDDVVALELSGGIALHELVRVDVGLPLYLASQGVSGPNGFAPGDLRVSALFAFLQPAPDGGVGVGIAPFVDLPLGPADAFLGHGGVVAGGTAAVTLEAGPATITGNLGAQATPAVDFDNLVGGVELLTGFGFGYRFGDVASLNLEGRLTSPVSASPFKGTGAPGEVLASARVRTKAGAHFLLGGATAITPGVGAAAFRVFLGGGFGLVSEGFGDRDGDGILDDKDACPGFPETVNGFEDEDGCPDQLGTLEVYATYLGSREGDVELRLSGPDGSEDLDLGRDGVQREARPGTSWEADAVKGECLAGREVAVVQPQGSTVATVRLMPIHESTIQLEVVDEKGGPIGSPRAKTTSRDPACGRIDTVQLAGGSGSFQLGAGQHSVFVEAEGYGIAREDFRVGRGETKVLRIQLKKTKVKLEKTRIVILDKVFFEFDKAVIKPESFDLLREVANTILANPDVGRVQVEGHTDDKGADQYNKELSQRRAESVVAFLVNEGVASDRLVPVGYGEERPIATNSSEAGRGQNRRVEFNLIDQRE